MSKFDNNLLYQIYLTKSDIFIRFQNLGMSSRLDISDLGQTYPMYETFLAFGRVLEPWHWFWVGYIQGVRHIQPSVGFQNHSNQVRSDISCLGRIYPPRPKSAELDSEFEG
jgi:hypothetical protein